VNFSNIVSAREGRNRRLLLGVALACIAAQPALAQSESESTNEDGNVLTGDIVVTANKREEVSSVWALRQQR
jgi:hypothetical protein